MKKLMMCAILALGMVASVAMAKELKIGVVNVAGVLKSAPQAVNMRNTLQKQFKPRQEKLLALQKRIEANKEKLTRESAVMAKSKRSQLEDSIAQDTRSLQRDQQSFMQDLQFSQKKEMRKLTTALNKTVESLAKQQHFDIILQNDQVVFASETTDITKLVLEALKKRNKK